jgi:predicted nuclease with TOPRIM domain
MAAAASSLEPSQGGGDAFEAELTRLEGEIREVNQRLDRLEEEALHALNDLALECFEEYR